MVVRELDDVFVALQRSPFRRRFRLGPREQAYLGSRGLVTVLEHAADFVAQRLAPAAPKNDGKQTPMRGHPVFVAQHATGTCCRGCLAKWHGIERGRPLSSEEQAHVIHAVERWLGTQAQQRERNGTSPVLELFPADSAADSGASE